MFSAQCTCLICFFSVAVHISRLRYSFSWLGRLPTHLHSRWHASVIDSSNMKSACNRFVLLVCTTLFCAAAAAAIFFCYYMILYMNHVNFSTLLYWHRLAHPSIHSPRSIRHSSADQLLNSLNKRCLDEMSELLRKWINQTAISNDVQQHAKLSL